MSASDWVGTIEIRTRSRQSNPLDAIRDALGDIPEFLAEAGGAPHHLTAMAWAASDLAAFDPARRDVDLACREILGGFCPSIDLIQTVGDGLRVTATAAIPPPPDNAPVWRDYSLAALARQYSARSQVPDMQPVFARWTRDGAAFRAGRTQLNVPYGPDPAMTFDLYRPSGVERPPLWVYLHGGYWQSVSKEQNAQFAAGMVDEGFAVANLDYGLCPQAPLMQIVAQVKAALSYLVREADRLGVDASRLHLAGHSAGAHLAAMMAADASAPPIRSALLISGIFDLTPIALLPMGRLLGLDDAAAIARLSASGRAVRPGTRIALAVGGLESDEFKRQSAEFGEACGASAPWIAEGLNHFDILETLIAGKLLDLALRIARE